MSTSDVKAESKANKEVDWSTLIEHCKAEITSYQEKIKTQNKSILYYEKQALSGAPSPRKKTK